MLSVTLGSFCTCISIDSVLPNFFATMIGKTLELWSKTPKVQSNKHYTILNYIVLTGNWSIV